MLQAIDDTWAEHLETVTEIREGIHLAEVGGLSPLEEFHKQVAASFDQVRDSLDARIVESFSSLEIVSTSI